MRKSSVLTLSVLRLIKGTLARYLAIFAIIALGVGFFAGLRISSDAMLKTSGDYLAEMQLYDFRLISTLGLEDADVAAFAALDGVEAAVGAMQADFLCETSAGDVVLRAHQLTEDLNRVELVAGRMPRAGNECLLEGKFSDEDSLGSVLTLSAENSAETFDAFAYDAYTVVGLVNAPYYLNFYRGTTTLGQGTLKGFLCLPAEGFNLDYYTDIYLSLGPCGDLFTDEYEAAVREMEPAVTALLEQRAAQRYERLDTDARARLADAQAELDEGREAYQTERTDAQRELDDALAQLTDARQELDEGWEQLTTGKETLRVQKADTDAQLDNARRELDEGWAALEEQKAQREAGEAAAPTDAEITETEMRLRVGELEYTKNLLGAFSILQQAEQELRDAEKTLREKEDEYSQALRTYEDARAEADRRFAEAEEQLADGQRELDEAREQFRKLEAPSTYVLDRSTNIGCATLENDMGIVRGIARVFPLFFFLVAALVCVTTMTRMVDEQRTQNGVLKALGYGSGSIIGQYLFYAGSASVLGCVAGFLLGSRFLPMALWRVYQIMYDVRRPVAFVLDWKLFAACSALFLLGSLGATSLVCRRDLRESAAELIRPRAPQAGKRVFLERLPFLWKRMKFLHKVSVRNILRYKKRMIMMILGVGGCTAMLLAGFGIRDSIQNIVENQYGEIETYDCAVSFRNAPDASEMEAFRAAHADVVADAAFLHTGAMDLRAAGKTLSVNTVVFDEAPDGFVDLHSGDAPVAWPGPGETAINFRLATDCGIKVGDSITLRDANMHELTLTVSGIFDNYLNDCAYIRADSFRDQWGTAPEVRTAYLHVAEGADHHAAAASILGDGNVAAVSVIIDTRERIGGILQNMNYVVLIVLVCAGALAFIVLYNLTNITINERRREIATLKVLGFYPKESTAYVFRENMILTLISAIIGLPMGYALLWYVMEQIKIGSFYFGCRAVPLSYVFSVALTIFFAAAVAFLLYFKLEKIDMADSLKAIE